MKPVYQTILLLILIIAMCFAGCSSIKRGCPSTHKIGWKIIKIDTLHNPTGYIVYLRRMNNIIKTEPCYCDRLPDSVYIGAIINL